MRGEEAETMDERKKRTLGLLLFLTVQVVSLAVLEHQQQTEAQQPMAGAGPSFTTQMLIPVLAMWESMHTTAIVAYFKRRTVSRDLYSDDEDGDELFDNGNVRNKKRKRNHVDRDRLANILISSNKALQVAFAEHIRGHIESQAQNSELDRIQRKEQSDQLVKVLGELADVMGLIADKL